MHAASRTYLVIFDSLGAHVIGTKYTLPRHVSGSYLCATRLLARIVRAKRKLDEVRVVDLLKSLDHPIPPGPIETRRKYFPWSCPCGNSQENTSLGQSTFISSKKNVF